MKMRDLILSSAGVSVGAFDFVKEVVDSNGGLDLLAREHAGPVSPSR